MAQHRTHSIAFKRQVVQEYLAGETLHGLARRHDLSRNLIRIWVDKYEAGAFDEDAEAATWASRYCAARSVTVGSGAGTGGSGSSPRLMRSMTSAASLLRCSIDGPATGPRLNPLQTGRSP